MQPAYGASGIHGPDRHTIAGQVLDQSEIFFTWVVGLARQGNRFQTRRTGGNRHGDRHRYGRESQVRKVHVCSRIGASVGIPHARRFPGPRSSQRRAGQIDDLDVLGIGGLEVLGHERTVAVRPVSVVLTLAPVMTPAGRGRRLILSPPQHAEPRRSHQRRFG